MTAGHFLYGMLVYLKEVHTLPQDEVTEKTTDAIFHYNSVMFVLVLGYILLIAMNLAPLNRGLLVFMGLWFIGSGGINFYYASRPTIGLFKMFQWILFFATGLSLLIVF